MVSIVSDAYKSQIEKVLTEMKNNVNELDKLSRMLIEPFEYKDHITSQDKDAIKHDLIHVMNLLNLVQDSLSVCCKQCDEED